MFLVACFSQIQAQQLSDGIDWVYIDDPGVAGHEGFRGYMSKNETTNAQYCEFLNSALASGDVYVEGDFVKGSSGSNSEADFIDQVYYELSGPGITYDGVTNGAAARINYSGGVFSVDSGLENHPVTYVSWYGSTAFCNYYGYRLPTEWEWQAVADYDGSYPYGFGTTINNTIANYRGSTHPDGTTTVGSYGEFGYGLCDLAGNAWEWVSSDNGANQYGFRGGCWADTKPNVSWNEYFYDPGNTYHGHGFRVCRDAGIEWVYVDDPGVDGHEPFKGYMSKYETTNAQFCAFLNAALDEDLIKVEEGIVYAIGDIDHSEDYFATHSARDHSQITFSGGTFTVRSRDRDGYYMGDHPAVAVGWYGAKAFCDYYGYRLPTEWEWQAVADYDGSYAYGCGPTIDHSKANYSFDNPLGLSAWSYTTPVNYYSSYGYGLHDMAGNVLEWTNNGYSGSETRRVLRGGSWYIDGCSVTRRVHVVPYSTDITQGFRACRDAGIEWVYVDDPGVDEHEGFKGYWSKYETTNIQYCEFLNAALETGDIVVEGDLVKGAEGSNSGEDFAGQLYYDLDHAGWSGDGATNGGAARIHFEGSVFIVEKGFENYPVNCISWYGATAFCNYYELRLPTEWEWQAVADYDGSFNYGCGEEINNDIANYLGSIHPDGTTSVGSFGEYGYGVCEMSGNVWEWVSSIDSGSKRVIRGGAWTGEESYCDVSYRSPHPPSAYSIHTGFRVCRDPKTYHVDGANGSDGNDGSSRENAFATIQTGIDSAGKRDTVLVWPGVYEEGCEFDGKAITVTSAADAAVVRNPDGFAFAFYKGEGPDSVLSNLVLAGGLYGVQINNGCSPTMKNLTIADNDYGIVCYEDASPDISHCILHDNTEGDIETCEIKNSWVQQDIAPMGYWALDEPNGLTAYDSIGDNDGSIYGATSTTGMVGNSLDFDGNDYVGLPIGNDYEFTNGLTIQAWIKSSNSAAGPVVVARGPGDGASSNYHALVVGSGIWFILMGDSFETVSVGTFDMVSDGKWHHVVGTYSNTEIALYVDNVKYSKPHSGIVSTKANFEIGRDNLEGRLYEPGRWFNGTIDEVAIYNRALSADDISELYALNLSGHRGGHPMFADADNGDYHLASERGRYWAEHDMWVLDKVTSPCVDAGDPAIDPSGEPDPNGGRVNLGAYGQTAFASMSEWPLKGDNNRDGVVNIADMAILAGEWLNSLPWVK